MAGLELERLRKIYPGGQVAIADASFTVADGELLVLVGPSGCGKSTLLRMIAGLESISAGTLRTGSAGSPCVPHSENWSPSNLARPLVVPSQR